MKRILIASLAVALLSAPTQAEDEGAPESSVAGEEREAVDVSSVAERILAALRLPEAASEARAAGVPEETVIRVLEQAQGDGVTAGDAGVVLAEGTRQVKEGRSPDSFGAFVQEQLAQGLRGKDLAAAIHETKGRGPGQAKNGSETARRVKTKKDETTVENQNPDDRDN